MIDLKTDSSSWTTEREENFLDDKPESRQQQLDNKKKTPLMIDLKADSKQRQGSRLSS
jgi:hypothetical protein